MKFGLRLLKTHRLTFYRPQKTHIGWGDDFGEELKPLELGVVSGSLQPAMKGVKVELSEGGFKVLSGFYFVTGPEVKLQGYEEGGEQYADYTFIEGKPYEIHKQMPWTGHGLNVDHHRFVLVRKPLPLEIP